MIQARLDSKRWPKKVLAPINGIPMIDRVHRQCVLSEIRPVVVAVPADDTELIEHCNKQRYCVYPYEGDRNDLIGRYYSALLEFGGDRVLRVTGDCIFNFPQEMVWVWMQGQVDDFTTNGWPEGRSVIDGCDVEVYSRRLFAWMNENVKDSFDREHLPLNIYKNEELYKSKFYIKKLGWPINLSSIKTSIDRPEDVENLRKLGYI